MNFDVFNDDVNNFTEFLTIPSKPVFNVYQSTFIFKQASNT